MNNQVKTYNLKKEGSKRSDSYMSKPQNEKRESLKKVKDKKNIIITAGPTNERLDAVMKITNMATGKLGSVIADEFLDNEEEGINELYYLSTKLARKPKILSSKLRLVQIESAKDLLEKMKMILEKQKIDAVIHSAAVGDYGGKYTITAGMLAKELANKLYRNELAKDELEKLILEILQKPDNVVSDEHKISSYEPDLMFKLDLTPKVIEMIKKTAPDTRLFGFKLLDGVSKEELIQVASKLREKNKAEYIIANDLANIHEGNHLAYFVGEDGVDYTCQNKEEIARVLRRLIF